jgi:hypothetical protein
MNIPGQILKTFNVAKQTKVKKYTDSQDVKTLAEIENFCPKGCDPSKTKVAISKVSDKDPGNFVKVYYKSSKKSSNRRQAAHSGET